MGRPSEFRQEFVPRVLEMAARGATDIEIADSLEVSVRTLYRWKAENAEFSQSLKVAKDIADERVERSLFQRATGYERDAVKVFMNKDGDPVYAPYREDVQPDTTACIFWLKNRQPDKWRDKTEVDVNEISIAERMQRARARRAAIDKG